MGVVREVLAYGDFKLLVSAGLISMSGDWVLRVGLTYHVYDVTGSTLASAGMLLSSFAPQVILGSVSGVFVDRWDRRRTMIVSNVLLAVGLLPLLLVTAPSTVWVVYAVMAWEGCVQQFFIPAEQALVPRLVPVERLLTANSLAGQTRDGSRLLGSAVGGVVAVHGGVGVLALLDIGTFLLAAWLIALMRPLGSPAPQPTVSGTGPAVARPAHWVRLIRDEWVAGLRQAAAHLTLRVVFVFTAITTLGEGVMSTLFAPFVHDNLQGSSQQYGALVSAQAIGGLLGGAIAAVAGHRVRSSLLLGWGAMAFGAVDLVMFLYPLGYPVIWPALLCMVVVGVPGALMIAGAMTLLQDHAHDSHRGRIFGAIGALEGVSLVVGTVVAGLLGQRMGAIPLLVAQGAGYVVAGGFVLVNLAVPRTAAEPVGDPSGV